MKNVKVLLATVASGILLSFADPCENIFFFKEGATSTMTSYDEDGKPTGSSKTTYSSPAKTSKGVEVRAVQEHFDKKGKPSVKNNFKVTCEGGVLYFDLKMMMPEQQTKAYQDMEMTMEGADLEMPNNLEVGKSLKDATMKLSFRPKGADPGIPMPGMTYQISVTNRKVEAKETITTSAGTFECYKISENVEMKTMFAIKAKSVNWFSPEVGNVKTESYKENGKYMGKSELTAITR